MNNCIKVFCLGFIVLFLLLLEPLSVYAKEKGEDKAIRINSFQRVVQKEPDVATRTIMSESNIPFTIPYIQTNANITAKISFAKKDLSEIKKVLFTLSANGHMEERRIVTKPFETVFA